MRNLNKIYSVFSLVMMTCLMGFIPSSTNASKIDLTLGVSTTDPCCRTIWESTYLNGDERCLQKESGTTCSWCC